MSTTVADAPLPPATELALDRTRLAYDRTLLAWIRTATSLISFGFTIYKFFQYMDEKQPGRERLFGPRAFALFMIGTGLIALLLATIGHRRHLQTMRAKYGHVQYSLAAILGALISLLGLLSFLAVVFRQ